MIRLNAATLAEELCSEFHSWAWIVGGQLLRSHCILGLEAGLLPLGVQTSTQFFPMKQGDLVLLKDSRVGGSGRDRLALIQCLRDNSNALTPAIHLATAFYAPTTLGMQLPPIPLRTQGEINDAVMTALGPCGQRLRREIQTQDRVREVISRKSFQPLWNDKAIAQELTRERRELKEKISELPEGEASIELHRDGEALRVHLELEKSQMNFSFAGTSASTRFNLPIAATSGIVRSVVREWLQWPRTLSAACESLISISTPAGCMLNAPSQKTCDETLGLSAALLRTAVESVLHRWDRRVRRGLTNYFDAKAVLLFEGRAPYTISLPSGSAAMERSEGVSFFDQRAPGMAFSPERFETLCPVLIESIVERGPMDGGPATHGGMGLSLTFRVLQTATLHWEEQPSFQLPLTKDQTPLRFAEIEIKRKGEPIPLAKANPIPLAEGDLVTIHSGSSGGLIS